VAITVEADEINVLKTGGQADGRRVVVLVGGVGGAKLAYGLAQILPPEQLTVIVNVADDFWHYGLRICPDLDTIMYTLSGLVDKTNGWGVAGDTTQMLDALRSYGEAGWFRLGDRDLATHLLRTQMLRDGARLTEVTAHLTRQLGIGCTVLPVSDDPIATMVDTVEYGELDFQTYFVRHRWQPQVKRLRYQGIEQATITPEVQRAISNADVILFGPSNPWLSIAPILDVPGMRDALLAAPVPRVAVTPIIGGRAVKGPAAKLMAELGLEVAPQTVAAYYGQVITGFIVDVSDAEADANDGDAEENLQSFGIQPEKLNTMMNNDEDKINLARQLLALTGLTQQWGNS
jgi:LPPG:FO 2-phospho-L-lactate transferase